MNIAEILYKFIITIFTAIKSSAFTEDFIAVLLMILGVIIVVNSLRAYFASKKNSETI